MSAKQKEKLESFFFVFLKKTKGPGIHHCNFYLIMGFPVHLIVWWQV